MRFSRTEAHEPGPRAPSRLMYTNGSYAFWATFRRPSGEMGLRTWAGLQTLLAASLDRPLRNDQTPVQTFKLAPMPRPCYPLTTPASLNALVSVSYEYCAAATGS